LESHLPASVLSNLCRTTLLQTGCLAMTQGHLCRNPVRVESTSLSLAYFDNCNCWPCGTWRELWSWNGICGSTIKGHLSIWLLWSVQSC